MAGPAAGDIREALDWLQQARQPMVTMLRRWCEQNSGSHHPAELQAMAAMLVEDFSALSVAGQCIVLPPHETIDDDGAMRTSETGPALLWHHRPHARNRLLLMIHYDTVYPPASLPVHCEATADGRLRGPGTADAKGGIGVIRWALDAVRRFALDQQIGWTVLLNPDEEIGSPASAPLMAALAPQYDFGLVFEPTLPDGAWVADRKGSGNWTFVVRGRSAHAGRNPEQGRNAIVHASRLVIDLDALNQLDAGVTINVGRTVGGGALNRVPDTAAVHLNVRITDRHRQQEIEHRLRGLAAKYDAVEGYCCQLVGRFHAPPKRADAAALRLRVLVQQAAEKVGRRVHWRDTGGACDGSKLAEMGLPNIDTLGPTGDHLHSGDEFCWIDSLVPAAQTVVQTIADFAADPQAFTVGQP